MRDSDSGQNCAKSTLVLDLWWVGWLSLVFMGPILYDGYYRYINFARKNVSCDSLNSFCLAPVTTTTRIYLWEGDTIPVFVVLYSAISIKEQIEKWAGR